MTKVPFKLTASKQMCTSAVHPQGTDFANNPNESRSISSPGPSEENTALPTLDSGLVRLEIEKLDKPTGLLTHRAVR